MPPSSRRSPAAAAAGLVAILTLACVAPKAVRSASDAGPMPDAGAAKPTDAGHAPDGGQPVASSCAPCLIDADCGGGEVCGQLPSDSFCVRTCSANAECGAGQVCYEPSSGTGYCVETSGACSSLVPDAGTFDAGPIGPPDSGLASNLTVDGGGTMSQLLFAVVGDTRPSIPDDDTGYPTQIITQIFQDIQSLNPRPPFVIGTGDYQYSTPVTGSGEPQLQIGIYNTARMNFTGIFWPVMGNHECGVLFSAGTANCGPSTTYGDTPNYTAWFNTFIAPMGEPNPYYLRVISAPDGSWSAKFIFLALNRWTDDEQTWFQQQLAGPAATYTFVIHHENATTSDAPPSLATVEAMEYSAHVTLSIVGHTHLWQHNPATSTNVEEVICGNGGAPLDAANQTYGYTLFYRQPDKSIAVTDYDYQTNLPVTSFVVAAP